MNPMLIIMSKLPVPCATCSGCAGCTLCGPSPVARAGLVGLEGLWGVSRMKTPFFSGKVGGDDHPPYKQKYPYLNENLFILKEEELYFLILLPKTFYAKINEDGFKILSLMDGITPLEAIVSDLSKDNNDIEKIKNFPEMIDRLNKLYGNMIPIIDTENIGDPEGIGNCGAGWRTYTVDPLKKMRPCPFFPIEFSSLSLANPEIRLAFFRLKSPNKETCNGCPYEYYCKGCIIRGYLMSRKMGFQCEWVKRFNVTEIFDRLKEDG